MKHPNRLRAVLSVLLCAALLSAAGAAFGEAEYATTREFLNYCDENAIFAEYEGIYSTSKREAVCLVFQNEAFGNIECVFLFDGSENSASLCLWDLLTVSPQKTDEALSLCNRLNHTYRYCKVSMDPQTRTVSMDADLTLTADTGTVGDQCYRYLVGMLQTVTQVIGDLRALEE